MHHCKKCNHLNFDEATVCHHCGVEFPPRPKPPKKKVRPTKAGNVLAIASCVVLALVGVIACQVAEKSFQVAANTIGVEILVISFVSAVSFYLGGDWLLKKCGISTSITEYEKAED